MRKTPPQGFTLIEVMITVAIVAILAAVAYPSYRDYIIRGRLVDATNGLTAMRADMERYFQDNRTYANVVGPTVFTTPCDATIPVARRTFGENFVVTCVGTLSATEYTLAATGNGQMTGFSFTINETGVRRTTTTAPGWISATNADCWLVRRGQC